MMQRFNVGLISILLAVANGQDCNLRGQCTGAQEVGVQLKSTYDDCQNVCRQTPSCQFFTFYASSSLCVLFTDCPSIDDAHCDDCRSCKCPDLPAPLFKAFIMTCQTANVSCPPVATRPCGHSGKCVGEVTSASTMDSARKCLRSCQKAEGCAWWNFSDRDRTCQLLRDCQAVETVASDTEAASFVYGTRDCDQYGC